MLAKLLAEMLHVLLCALVRALLAKKLRSSLNSKVGLNLNPNLNLFLSPNLNLCLSLFLLRLLPSRQSPVRSPHGRIVAPAPGRYHTLWCRHRPVRLRPHDKDSYHARRVALSCKFRIL